MSLARLTSLCADERRALLAGDLGALAAIADEKDRLLQRLRDHASADELGAARQACAANADLLQAAMSGLRRARERLAALGSVSDLRTYDGGGVARTVPRGPTRITRTA